MAAVAYNDWLSKPSISSSDRLSFTIFLAILLHAAIILGVTFSYLEQGASSHTMEVTLAQYRSTNPPSKADYLAQFDQQGSGTLEEKKMITTNTLSQFQDTKVRETAIPQVSSARVTPELQSDLLLTTIGSSATKANQNEETREQKLLASYRELDRTILQKSMEIASLEARLDQLRQVSAKRPRIKRLTSLSTRSSIDAHYLNSWRRRVETIGNLNYPEEARRNKTYGHLRLMVAILPNGTLKEVEILQSSGHKSLDDAAIKIVRLASPYEPFPDELKQNADILEIIRTWQFRKNSSLRTY